MKNQDKRRTARLRNMIIIFALTAIIISVSTYAWFIGMKTVQVNSFDVEIAATDSLMLSLDGEHWSSTLDLGSDFDTFSYADHTNTWGGEDGLIPMSSIGDMDTAASRMKLYEKASLTPTAGGYRLLASRVNNTGTNEQDGYVAFDLFVRNFTGTQYIKPLNPKDEEAIYLTVESDVTVSSTGVKDTGIENSVRVAFAQIGRIKGDIDTTNSANVDKITGITCTSDTDITGICRTAKIWEPNDKTHVKYAIDWYETSCLARKNGAEGADVRDRDSYNGTCGRVVDGLAYPTYAVNDVINSDDEVDVYDGVAYNSYTSTSQLTAYPYFTDTAKLLMGTARPEFMTLAPNSITKIRIYIYLEGQDIDNYDFASIGRSISVKFGFTKERFTEDDIDYDGEDLNQGAGPSASDKTVPVISIAGGNKQVILENTAFTYPTATAEDNIDGDLTVAIERSGTVNATVPGEYTVVYRVKDAAENIAVKALTVVVMNQSDYDDYMTP